MTVTIADPVPLPFDSPTEDAPSPAGHTPASAHSESAYFSDIFGTNVIVNVTEPTLTPVLPDQPNGTAVVIAPGGGYHALSIDSEGYDAARWLGERGVTSFVLKYRLVPGGADPVAELAEKMATGAEATDMLTTARLAIEDARHAVRTVRERAAEWGVAPDRVGFLGFSAGGHVGVHLAHTASVEERADFFGLIYPALMGDRLEALPPGVGALFVAAASDDELGLAPEAIALYEHWIEADRLAELHLYANGGHGFGMRPQGLPSDTWIERFGDWLVSQQPR